MSDVDLRILPPPESLLLDLDRSRSLEISDLERLARGSTLKRLSL